MEMKNLPGEQRLNLASPTAEAKATSEENSEDTANEISLPSALNRKFFGNSKKWVSGGVLLNLLVITFSTVPAVSFSVVLDHVVHKNGHSTLPVLLAVVIVAHLAERISKKYSDILISRAKRDVSSGLQNRLLNQLNDAPLDRVERVNSTIFESRFNSIQDIVGFGTDWYVTLISTPIFVGMMLAIFLWLSPLIGFIMAGMSCLYVFLHIKTGRPLRQVTSDAQKARDTAVHRLSESVRSIVCLRTHGAFEFMRKKWRDDSDKYESVHKKQNDITDKLGSLSKTYQQLCLLVMIGVGALEVIEGNMTVGQLIMANLLSVNWFQKFEALRPC